MDYQKGETKKTIPFTISSKIINTKANLTKGIKNLYSENDKTLMKKRWHK